MTRRDEKIFHLLYRELVKNENERHMLDTYESFRLDIIVKHEVENLIRYYEKKNIKRNTFRI